MRRMRITTLVSLLSLIALHGVPAAQTRRVVRQAGTPRTADSRPIGAEEKSQVGHALKEAIGKYYLFPERVGEIAARIDELLGSAKYASLDDAQTFARMLTDDLRASTGDLHFAVLYDPERFSRLEQVDEDSGDGPVGFGGGLTPPDPDSPLYRMMVDRYAPTNYEMRKIEILDGNIAYLRLDSMPPLDPAKRTIDAAMAFTENADALIIDLRGTPGGVGGFIPYFMSYFFPEGNKLLFSREFGAEGRVQEYRTTEEIGGRRRPDIPIYILTDGLTGSAAENLSYTLKHHGRATVIGETTAGAGHSARSIALAAGFTANIPIARVIHPVTKTGFDAVGVKPDVEVPSAEALRAAHKMAIEQLLAAAPAGSPEEGRRRAALDALESASLAARAAEELADVDLSVYTGTYGERTVTLDNGRLSYQRRGGPKVPLAPIGVDLFRLDVPAAMRAMRPVPDVRFERDAGGTITGFSLVRADGTVEETVAREG